MKYLMSNKGMAMKKAPLLVSQSLVVIVLIFIPIKIVMASFIVFNNHISKWIIIREVRVSSFCTNDHNVFVGPRSKQSVSHGSNCFLLGFDFQVCDENPGDPGKARADCLNNTKYSSRIPDARVGDVGIYVTIKDADTTTICGSWVDDRHQKETECKDYKTIHN